MIKFTPNNYQKKINMIENIDKQSFKVKKESNSEIINKMSIVFVNATHKVNIPISSINDFNKKIKIQIERKALAKSIKNSYLAFFQKQQFDGNITTTEYGLIKTKLNNLYNKETTSYKNKISDLVIKKEGITASLERKKEENPIKKEDTFSKIETFKYDFYSGNLGKIGITHNLLIEYKTSMKGNLPAPKSHIPLSRMDLLKGENEILKEIEKLILKRFQKEKAEKLINKYIKKSLT